MKKGYISLESFVKTLNRFADYHEEETKDHSRRTRIIALQIGQRIGMKPEDLMMLGYGADLHDIGKLFIDPFLIRQASKLSKSQQAQMQTHTVFGVDALEFAELPEPIVDIVRHHHEHFDGSGYPDQLSGEQITIYSRITCIADVWDAITSNRPYRSAMTNEAALWFMNKHAAWFDPELFEIWLKLLKEETIQ